jgi:hypothetical protein
MKIKNFPDVNSWEQVALTSPETTFFHTPLWHKIVVKTYKHYRIATKEFTFDDGTRALIPFIQTKKGGLFKGKERLKSSVFNMYGGIISDKTLSTVQQNQIFNYLISLKANISIMGNPFSDYKLPMSFNCKEDFTDVIALDKGEEYIFQRLSRNARKSIRRAIKREVTVRTIQTEEEIKGYYEVYRDTINRWGDATKYIYPQEIFLNIFRDAGDALKIWVAEKNGKMIAVLTVFYWNNLVTPFHTASLKDYFDCCPNNILHMEVIKDAINKNYRYYDFGPSGGEDGVVQFKKSFRAEKLFLVSGYWKPR